MKFYLTTLFMWISMEIYGQTLPKNEPVRFLALGDSYTIGESVGNDRRWPAQLMKALAEHGYTCLEPVIVATTGWRTDDLKGAIKTAGLANDYNLVSLLIGVNNQYQGKGIKAYAVEFEELLNIAIQCAGGNKSKVFVLSIPDYGFTPFGKNNQQETSPRIDAFNDVNESITEKKEVLYINVTDISRRGLEDPLLVAEDGLHPSGEMYTLWVERILESIVE